MSLIAPEHSLVLLKPSGIVPHEGGRRFAARFDRGRGASVTGSKRGARDEQCERAVAFVRCGSFPPNGFWRPGCFEQQLVVTAELERRHDARRHAAGRIRRERPDAGRGFLRRAGQGDARLRNGRQRSLHERPRDGPAGVPGRGLDFVWRGAPATGPFDELVFAKLKAMRINPSGDLQRFGLPATGVSRRDRPASRASGGSVVSGRCAIPRSAPSWSIAWSSGPSLPISGL